jgi:hypothetical protein
MEGHLRNNCCSGKAISIAYSKYMFLALGNQHAMCMWPVQLYNIFFALSHKRQDFRERKKECKIYVLFSLQILSETFLILRRTERNVMKNIYYFSCKYPLFLSDCN